MISSWKTTHNCDFFRLKKRDYECDNNRKNNGGTTIFTLRVQITRKRSKIRKKKPDGLPHPPPLPLSHSSPGNT